MHKPNRKRADNPHKGPHPFHDAAIRIGQRLAKEAIWHDRRCTWTGDDFDLVNDQWRIVHKTVDTYLYSGTAGIAKFLSACWKTSGHEYLRETAIGAIRQSLHFAEQHSDKTLPLGLYDGLTGIALIATDIGNSLQEPELAATARELTEEIRCRIASGQIPETADLVSGLSGIVIGLIQLAKITDDTSLYNECHLLSEELLARAQHTDYGWHWPETGAQNPSTGLCGLAHGASGVALALLEYSGISQSRACLAAARQAMRYERSWFNRWQSNWPDLRDTHAPERRSVQRGTSYPVYWCHGAAGIGLARLRAYRLTHDKSFLAEASAAIEAATRQAKQLIRESRRIRRMPPDTNLSLCHGLGSIIDLFICAYHLLGSEEYLQRARDIGAFGIRASTGKREYWHSGIHGGGETPGLMLGLAGIGYNFLRLHHPDKVDHDLHSLP